MNRILLLFALLVISLSNWAQAPPVESFGGFTELVHDTRDEITPEHRQLMFKTIRENIAMLAKKGITAQGMLRRGPVTTKFGWPLRKAAGFNDPGYYGISNFVDVDVTKGNIKDFNCGTRTYDGHMGTDIFTVPFWWKKMDENSVEIVAAADGIIVGKETTKDDKSCANCPEGDQACFAWNVVSVQHADGSIAIYGHMKKNSATSKVIGDPVTKGEFLGVVGSSGNSSGPHLHFEVWENDEFRNLLLPWEGPCNPDGNATMWDVQQPYYNPQIIKLMSGSGTIETKACYDGGPENTFEKTEFTIGETVYFTGFVRDHRGTGPNYVLKLIGPGNKVIYSWTLAASTWPGHYTWLYFYYYWNELTFKEPGTYKFTLNYGSEYAETIITMKDALPLNLLSFSARAADDKVTLNWQTAAETNTAFFEIQHGTDAQHLEMIGKLATTGNGRSGKNDYTFNHYNPAGGMNFYRLKMMDKDGKFKYSEIKKVNFEVKSEVRMLPNPADNYVILQKVRDYNTVSILNMNGKRLLSKTIEGDDCKIDISSLPRGIYLVQLKSESNSMRMKLIKN